MSCCGGSLSSCRLVPLVAKNRYKCGSPRILALADCIDPLRGHISLLYAPPLWGIVSLDMLIVR